MLVFSHGNFPLWLFILHLKVAVIKVTLHPDPWGGVLLEQVQEVPCYIFLHPSCMSKCSETFTRKTALNIVIFFLFFGIRSLQTGLLPVNIRKTHNHRFPSIEVMLFGFWFCSHCIWVFYVGLLWSVYSTESHKVLRKSCNTLLVACIHLASWESAKSMSHGGGFKAFPVVKRGPKREHYAYAKRQGCYNTEPGIVTNIGGNGVSINVTLA